MAKKRRPSPTEQDIKRIAETVNNLDTFGKIKDKDSFDKALDEYLGDENDLSDDKRFKRDVFQEYSERYGIEEEEERPRPQKRQVRPKRNLNIAARSKGRIVFAEETQVTVKGKPQKRLRDKNGRFASRKR